MACAVIVASALGATAALFGAVAALGLSTSPAPADESLNASGSITFTWQGDPSHGCAAVGVCDVRGALIIQAQGAGGDAQRFGHQTIITLGGGGSEVRVSTGTGQGARECVDASGEQVGLSIFVRHSSSGLVAALDPALSSGRCAGPLAQDLAGLHLALAKTGGRRPTYDLRGTQSYVAGPFSGTVVSTMVLGPASGGFASGGFSSSSASGFGGPPRHKVLTERVSLTYRVASLPGALETSFAGTSDPSCAALDSCGATGTLSLSPAVLQGRLIVTASRAVHRSVSGRQAIADFRAGRLGKPLGSLGGRSGAAVVSETYAGGDGLRCQDSVSSNEGEFLFVGPGPGPGFGGSGVGGPGRGGAVGLTLSVSPRAPLLRTHCPGPTDVDVFGSFGVSARGSVSDADLLRRSSDVALSDPGGFGGVGYVGSRSGAIRLSLTLERVSAGTVEVRQP
ncbi:MAG: hypothetical protein JO243_24545 [Solirubrobacterales bacterium]|nr:hypothetical protein [Solirubrobacterales bacterium]